MKKVLIIICSIIMGVAVCGCDGSVVSDNDVDTVATTQSTEQPTTEEIVTTTVAETTVAATDEPTTVIETTAESVAEIKDDNRISFGDYSLILPDNYTYALKDDYYCFYEKTIYD